MLGFSACDNVDRRAWLADVLHGIADQPTSGLDGFLPWNWRNLADTGAVAA